MKTVHFKNRDPLRSIFDHDSPADIYGLILYSNGHPHVKQALRDQDYWEALDYNSGNKMAVYAKRPMIDKTIEVRESHQGSGSVEDSLIFMVPRVYDVKTIEEEDQVLMKELGLSGRHDLPCVIILARAKEVVLHCCYSINTKTQEEAYHSINEILKVANDTLDKFKEQHLKNPESLFREVTGNLDSVFSWRRIENHLDLIKKIKSYTNIF